MGNTTTMMVFISTVNIIFFLAQAAIVNINPDTSSTFYNNSGTIFDDAKAMNTKTNFTDILPETTTIVGVSGNPFIDIFASIKAWVSGNIGFKIINAFFQTPYMISKSLHLPELVSNGIFVWWWGITLVVVILFLRGND
jgi:hypothetical protein